MDQDEDTDATALYLFNRYRVMKELGVGYFGDVVLAHDTKLKRPVAIKILKRLHVQNRDILDRFQREAEVGALVGNHPHLVTVYDSVTDHEGVPYLILEYVSGGTVADRITQGPIPLPETLRLIGDAINGLHAAHEAGIVHRDVKPANLFLSSSGRLQVGDFSIAQIDNYRLTSGPPHPGTPAYMSPEQERSVQFLSPASDQYSLGLVLFEMLTGKRYRSLTRDEASAYHNSLPRGVQTVLSRMLEQDPYNRYSSMREVTHKLLTPDEDDESARAAIARCYGQWRTSLGEPRSEVQIATPSMRGTTGMYQSFERGTIHWSKAFGTFAAYGGIGHRFVNMGGSSGRLGFPVTDEGNVAVSPMGTIGRLQRFEGPWLYSGMFATQDGAIRFGATIYWSERYDAQPTLGGIGEHYEVLGGTGSALGFPIAAEEEALQAPTGTSGYVQRFERGFIHWSEYGGAHASVGEISKHYADNGGSSSAIGFPIIDEMDAPPSWRGTTGRLQRFERGAIYWSERTNAHSVRGFISRRFEGMGGTASRLGFPVTQEKDAATSPFGTTGRYQRFEGPGDCSDDLVDHGGEHFGSTIYWSEQYGAHFTWCGIGYVYERSGGTGGQLGFPTSGELEARRSPIGTTGMYQCFEGGAIFWSERNGNHSVTKGFWEAYRNAGSSGGILGFPVGEVGESPLFPSFRDSHASAQEFEGGWLHSVDGPDTLPSIVPR